MPSGARSPLEPRQQQPFALVAPLLAAALVLGPAGGLLLATILTISQALRLPLGRWWSALAQAHGHLQLYGWIGLFVLGVAFHFMPRLRGSPLVGGWSLPWLSITLVSALALRALSQPLVALTGGWFWRALLIASGVLEGAALLWALVLLLALAGVGAPPRTRPALWSILPLLIGALVALGAATCVNLANTITAATAPSGLVPAAGDALNVTLGLFGFIVPVALAMATRSLPMYAGLGAFPRRMLWPLAGVYLCGVALLCAGTLGGLTAAAWPRRLSGLGMLLVAASLVAFVVTLLRMMRARGVLPARVARLAQAPTAAQHAYRRRVAAERDAFGPFVALIGSAFGWASVGGLLLAVDGIAALVGNAPPVNLDAARHSLALGFVALLLCGVAPRLIPGFSGGHIQSAALVTATLWLGNGAAFLRVVPLLAAPALAALGPSAGAWGALAFGLSGPVGLALGICLAVNLWPALFP